MGNFYSLIYFPNAYKTSGILIPVNCNPYLCTAVPGFPHLWQQLKYEPLSAATSGVHEQQTGLEMAELS